MKEVKITCDGCGKDITYTSNEIDYRLLLANECIPVNPKNNTVTSMYNSPHIRGDKHFCHLACLVKWAEGLRSGWGGENFIGASS